jgi:ferredoxin
MANIIFYYTGTGNSLNVAKKVSNEISNCEIFPTGANKGIFINKKYDSIGFIYPIHFWGVPKDVKDFISEMTIENNENTYVYAIATYGGLAGNGIKLLEKMLLEKNIKLNYGKALKIFSNYIISFNKPKKFRKILEKSDKKLMPIIDAIKNKKTNSFGKINKMLYRFYAKFIDSLQNEDENYSVNNNCIGCGICKEVCPVNNIEIIENKPEFKHKCEQCLACIHHCPQEAINYKDKTQKKRRYTNPEISYKELSANNKLKYQNI